MLEVFRVQLRHMLAGHRKWLVVVFLAMPIGLTLLTMHVGGLGELKRKIEQPLGQGDDAPLEGMQRVEWAGEDIWLGKSERHPKGVIEVRENRIVLHWVRRGRDYSRRYTRGARVDVDNGVVIVDRRGQVWVDPTREARGGRPRMRFGRDFAEVMRTLSDPWKTLGAMLLFVFYPWVIVLLLAMLYGSSLLGTELDNQTLTYLLTRPMPRWKIVVGKYLAIVTALIPPTAVSLTVSWAILDMPGSYNLLGALLVACVGGVFAYNGIFMSLGFVLPRFALVVSLIYAVLLEGILAMVPALINSITVTYYLRSIVVEQGDIEVFEEIRKIVGGASWSTSVLALCGVVAVCLGISSMLIAKREYRMTDEP